MCRLLFHHVAYSHKHHMLYFMASHTFFFICSSIEVVEVAAGIAPWLAGEHVENVATGIDCYSVRQPLGVSERKPMQA